MKLFSHLLYAVFLLARNAISFQSMRNKLSNLSANFHIETQRGTSEQAIAYCKKDGNFRTHGTEPSTRAAGSLAGDLISMQRHPLISWMQNTPIHQWDNNNNNNLIFVYEN